jgi:lysophospholipase L1-like esterase
VSFLLILGGCLLNPWLYQTVLRKAGPVDLAGKIWVALFGAVMLGLGLALVLSSTRRALLRNLMCWLVGLLLVLAALMVTESALTVAGRKKNAKTPESDVSHQKYAAAYGPFTEQYLHPFYYFDLPQDPSLIQKINNQVCSISPGGYRGSDPAWKGDRKLAFVLGGSAAFGHGCSSDTNTISGCLNRLQAGRYFVNAGVPSWNSLQEFYRLSLELVQHQPDLIVVFDGFNDAIVSYHHARENFSFPPGTPESYEFLQQKVAEIKRRKKIVINARLSEFIFPRLARWINQATDTAKASPEAVAARLQSACQGNAEAYVRHIQLMQKVCDGYGVKLVVVAQPAFFLHQNTSEQSRTRLNYASQREFVDYYRAFTDRVLAAPKSGIRFADFTRLFDRKFKEVPLGDVFVDQVHLFDKGNEMVAQEILAFLAAQGVP